MTKWKRLRKRREREKAEAGALNPAAEVEETKPTETLLPKLLTTEVLLIHFLLTFFQEFQVKRKK